MEHVTDHVEQALAREAQQLKGRPLWEGFISAFVTEVQAVEDALFGLIAGRALDTAVGVQLEGLGSILGENRLGADDETYRQRLRARIALNVGSADTERIIRVLSLATGLGVEVINGDVAELLVRLHGVLSDGTTPARLLSLARAGGVAGRLEWSPAADASMLLFDDAPGLGDFNDGTVGGQLAGELVA